MYLLDTNILADLVRHPQGPVADRIAAAKSDAIATSIVVAAELRYGAARRGSARLTLQLEAILAPLNVIPLGEGVDIAYGRLRADLESRRLVIGGNDMLIAAHALALEAVLVTDNVREFERVAGLGIENWMRPG